MLSAHHLHYYRQQRLLFSDLSFQIAAGKLLLITGENGSGKSSLLRLLTGLSLPHQGEISWQGKPIRQWGTVYWENMHFVSHHHGIKLGLTVQENLQFTRSLLCQQTIAEESLLKKLRLDTQPSLLANYLSAGQKRRLALAKLFLFPRKIWILDEPLSALDSATQQFFLTQLENHLKNDGLAILSTHQPIYLKDTPTQTLTL